MFVLYLPSTHSQVQHNFYWTAGSSYSLKTSFVAMFAEYPLPKTKTNISKIKIYTGINNHRTEIKQHGAGRLTSFSFSLQKDTRTWNKLWKAIYNKKNHLSTSNVYSISVNPDIFSFSQ